jgi:hypothetical protein
LSECVHLSVCVRSTWSVYGCDISEQLIKEQALAIDRLGLRELGYTYIDIDDWCV